jgi:hypothetical protein
VFFMSTALLLVSFLPGDGSAAVSADIREATLTELLAGSWDGTWTREGQTAPLYFVLQERTS